MKKKEGQIEARTEKSTFFKENQEYRTGNAVE